MKPAYSSIAAALAAALMLVIGAHARPEPEPARGAPVAQFCQPQEPSAEVHRLFCRNSEG